MVPFNLALEAKKKGWIFDLSLTLVLLVDLGLLLVDGDKSKSILFVGGIFHNQHILPSWLFSKSPFDGVTWP
jgi:hypothetical protein